MLRQPMVDATKTSGAADFAQAQSSRLSLRAVPCPFSVQPCGKLMQKVHSLTDN